MRVKPGFPKAVMWTLVLLLFCSPSWIRAVQKPDLVVKEITWSPATVLTGGEVTFTIVLANIGAVPSEASKVEFQTGTQAKNLSIPGLHPNARNYVLTEKRSFNMDFNFVVKATVDSRSQVAESNENNNVLQKTLAVQPASDFAVSDITWTPASPTTTDRVELRAVVINRGPGTSFPTKGHFQFGTTVENARIPALSSGQTHTVVKYHVFTQPFHYVIKFTADPDDDVPEEKENNNGLEKTLAVTQAQKPDLTIRNMALNPASPGLAQPAQLTAKIRNLGPGPSFACKLLLRQGNVSKQYNIPALDMNEVHTFTKLLVFPDPNLNLVPVQLIVDSDNELAEANENNNVAQIMVRVSQ